MEETQDEGKAILAALHGAVDITFESPVPTGELLGQAGYPITVRKNVRKSLRQLIDEVASTYEQLYTANKIDLIYWKDIQIRIKNLNFIQDDTHAESKFATICNTLGCRRIKLVNTAPEVYGLYPSSRFDICTTGKARYDLIYRLIQEPYKAIMYLQSRSSEMRDYLQVEHFVLLYERCLDILGRNWKSAVEDKHQTCSLSPEHIAATTVLKGFSGFWTPKLSYTFQERDIINQYYNCLEYDAPDYEIDEDKLMIVPIRYDLVALFDEDGPYDITSEAYDPE